jgi:hypothetical protein
MGPTAAWISVSLAVYFCLIIQVRLLQRESEYTSFCFLWTVLWLLLYVPAFYQTHTRFSIWLISEGIAKAVLVAIDGQHCQVRLSNVKKVSDDRYLVQLDRDEIFIDSSQICFDVDSFSCLDVTLTSHPDNENIFYLADTTQRTAKMLLPGTAFLFLVWFVFYESFLAYALIKALSGFSLKPRAFLFGFLFWLPRIAASLNLTTGYDDHLLINHLHFSDNNIQKFRELLPIMSGFSIKRRRVQTDKRTGNNEAYILFCLMLSFAALEVVMDLYSGDISVLKLMHFLANALALFGLSMLAVMYLVS